MFQAQNRETINSTLKVSVSFKIFVMSVTRPCFTTQHQTSKTVCKLDQHRFLTLCRTGLALRSTVSDHITGVWHTLPLSLPSADAEFFSPELTDHVGRGPWPGLPSLHPAVVEGNYVLKLLKTFAGVVLQCSGSAEGLGQVQRLPGSSLDQCAQTLHLDVVLLLSARFVILPVQPPVTKPRTITGGMLTRDKKAVLVYESQTWTLLASDIKKLEAFHLRCRRQLLCVSWWDHITNDRCK